MPRVSSCLFGRLLHYGRPLSRNIVRTTAVIRFLLKRNSSSDLRMAKCAILFFILPGWAITRRWKSSPKMIRRTAGRRQLPWCEETWEGASSLIPETGFRGKQESISLLIERTPERKTWIGWRITVQECGERWASWQEMVKPQKNQSGSTKTQPGSGEGYRALSAGKSVACLRRELGDRPIIINVTILVD